MRNKGFTLIELMIVVVVVAILTAVALPSYRESVRKNRRAQAKADMTEIAQGFERWYTVQRTYSTFTIPFSNSPREAGATVGYVITAATPNAKSFTLTATSTAAQNDTKCGPLTLDQAGTKHHGGSESDTYCGWGTAN